MDPETQEQWQALHRRVVQGEGLSPAERAAYEAGCAKLDQTKLLDGDIAKLRELRTRISEAEAEQRMLQDQEAQLESRIEALEGRLDQRTRQLLGIG